MLDKGGFMVSFSFIFIAFIMVGGTQKYWKKWNYGMLNRRYNGIKVSSTWYYLQINFWDKQINMLEWMSWKFKLNRLEFVMFSWI
jgi:hypothetical protein